MGSVIGWRKSLSFLKHRNGDKDSDAVQKAVNIADEVYAGSEVGNPVILWYIRVDYNVSSLI